MLQHKMVPTGKNTAAVSHDPEIPAGTVSRDAKDKHLLTPLGL
jgi:hypothetical protein